MTVSIEELYQQALLADAAYVDGSLSEIQRRILLESERKFTPTQADNFLAKYDVVASFRGRESGLDATIYVNPEGKQFLAVRGTEPTSPSDLLEIGPGVDFLTYSRATKSDGGV